MQAKQSKVYENEQKYDKIRTKSDKEQTSPWMGSEFRYLGTFINFKNLISNEIKWIAAGNWCSYSLRQIFKTRAKSKAVKIKIYKWWWNQLQCLGVKHELWLKWLWKDRVHGRERY